MARQHDEETSIILATGEVTFAQAAKLFETDPKTLPQRCRRIRAVGKRKGYSVYKISDIASCIIKPNYEIEPYIRQMSPQELPPLLLKEFWNGQKARLAFEKENGNLWPTEDVVELVAVLQKALQQSIMLMTDDVDREEAFTDGQKRVFRRKMDEAIVTVRETIKEKLKDHYADAEREEQRKHGGLSGRVPDAEDDEEVDI